MNTGGEVIGSEHGETADRPGPRPAAGCGGVCVRGLPCSPRPRRPRGWGGVGVGGRMRGPERAGLTSLPAGPPPSGAAFPAPSGAGSGGAAEPSAAGLGAQSRDAGCSARCLAAPESSHRPAARLVASLSRSPRLQPLRPPVPRGRKSLPPPPPVPGPFGHCCAAGVPGGSVGWDVAPGPCRPHPPRWLRAQVAARPVSLAVGGSAFAPGGNALESVRLRVSVSRLRRCCRETGCPQAGVEP